MKKSCSSKESKVRNDADADAVVVESKEVVQERTVDQHKLKNTKSECNTEGEEIYSLEKECTIKSTPIVNKLQRASSRLTKLSSGKTVKWIDNSFEVTKKEDKTSSNKCNTPELGKHKHVSKINSSIVGNDECHQDHQGQIITKNKVENEYITSEQFQNTSAANKICGKIEFEGNLKKENNISNHPEGGSPNLLGKKRLPHKDKIVGSPKKIKMEEANNNNNNDEMPLNNENSLEIEVELEKRRKNTPFKIRDIKTIVTECEIRNTKWKETFSKYKCPTRWGIPIVKNCCEKWDGKEIPPELLNRYQKFLISRNMYHSVFFPSNSHISIIDKDCYSNHDVGSEFKTIVQKNNIDVSNGQEQFKQDDPTASSNSTDDGGRMVLRNRNQYKPVVIEEDEYFSDDSDDWTTKQKSGRNKAIYKANTKNKKSGPLHNQQLVSKLERCNINKKNGVQTEDDDLMGHTLLGQGDGNTKPEPETMVCPICSLRFPKQLIESHATECATKTFKD